MSKVRHRCVCLRSHQNCDITDQRATQRCAYDKFKTFFRRITCEITLSDTKLDTKPLKYWIGTGRLCAGNLANDVGEAENDTFYTNTVQVSKGSLVE